jgi:hypothetical protein
MTSLLGHHRVLQPGVTHPIPEDVHEANQAVPIPSEDPPQAVPVDLIDPAPLGLVENAGFECFSLKLVQFEVVERAPRGSTKTPLSGDSRAPPRIRRTSAR